jgi:hypothetical protein
VVVGAEVAGDLVAAADDQAAFDLVDVGIAVGGGVGHVEGNNPRGAAVPEAGKG